MQAAAGSFIGLTLFAFWAWGWYRVHMRGPDGEYGASGWAAIILPPCILLLLLTLYR